MRLRDLVELVRAPAALSVPGDAVAGAAAAGTLGGRTAGLATASVCLYWAGMAANDWADRDLDAVERPERPIPSGRITPAAALGVAGGLTAAGLAVAALTGGRRALAVAVPLVGAIWAYDVAWKNTDAGPAGMALCRGLDVLLGASTGKVSRALWPALVVASHTYTVTALSRREVHGADRDLPARTLVATAAIAAAPVLGRQRRLSALLGGWYAARYGGAQRRAFDDPSAANVRASVGAGITALPALQGALTASAGAPVTGAVLAAAAPLARALARKVSPT
ncbi:transferase [Longispora fulva]|uniref:4-hydroxybenzoate polyprenyltransferase n=1 Tax=Longispora fulva TaxID=619741 RepID=A0A8J7KNU6_9ACTN|nr:UbiA family prenyltransferase [Longispora fulva]MBG6135582.1 4-hydroxybenzoate polyprenyltransferase [Longispora fulva]GIG56179.1 transferase [Longispora fulva]